jgi:hypothetical protein
MDNCKTIWQPALGVLVVLTTHLMGQARADVVKRAPQIVVARPGSCLARHIRNGKTSKTMQFQFNKVSNGNGVESYNMVLLKNILDEEGDIKSRPPVLITNLTCGKTFAPTGRLFVCQGIYSELGQRLTVKVNKASNGFHIQTVVEGGNPKKAEVEDFGEGFACDIEGTIAEGKLPNLAIPQEKAVASAPAAKVGRQAGAVHRKVNVKDVPARGARVVHIEDVGDGAETTADNEEEEAVEDSNSGTVTIEDGQSEVDQSEGDESQGAEGIGN